MTQVWVKYDKDGDYELNYHIKEDEDSNYNDRVSLVRSAGEWSADSKNTVAGSYVDDGNGIDIKLDGQKKIRLDYAQVEALFILLHSTFTTSFYIAEQKIVNEFKVEDDA